MIRLFVAALVASMAGCGGDDGGSTVGNADAVAVLDGDPIGVEDVERYLTAVLGEVEDEPLADDDIDRVKSRLFDDFLDEEILLREAQRRGISVDAAEVDAYLDAAPDDEQAEPDESVRRMARRNLMIQKLRGRAVGAGAAASPAEIDAYLEENRDALAADRSIVLRSFSVNSEKDAAAIRGQILRGEVAFEKALEVFGESQEQGEPIKIALGDLPEEIRTAVGGLRTGQVSQPVEYQDHVWLFLIDAGASDLDEGELREQARIEVERRKSREASERLLHEARARTEVVLREANLPFRYVAATDAS